MKKLLSLIAAVLIITACSNQEDANSSQQLPVKHTSSIRSFDEALQIAQSSISILEGSDITRSGSTRKIDLNNSKVYKLDAITRSSSTMNDTLMYIFNFEDNQGFAVVSASKATEGLLAITESGNYSPDSLSEIEGLNMYMDYAKAYVENSTRGQFPLNPIDPGRDSFAVAELLVGPYVSVKWGQRHPEGELCPNSICGCANTAIGQLLSYYEYPTSVQLSYPERDITQMDLNWTLIKQHQTGHDSLECSTPLVHKSISRLCRESGYMSNSSYNQNSTGTSLSGIIDALEGFGYTSCDWVDYENCNLVQNLDNEHPMIMSGFRETGSGLSGHAWILDGYWKRESYHYRIDYVQTIYGTWVEDVTLIDITTTTYYHVNWGWSGNSNGYYSYNVFNPQSAYYYDLIGNSPDRNYNIDLSTLVAYPNNN